MNDLEQRQLLIKVFKFSYDLLKEETKKGNTIKVNSIENGMATSNFNLTKLDKPTIMALQIIPALLMLSFNTEVAIKALIMKTKNQDVRYKHNLDKLLKMLNGSMQNTIRKEVMNLIGLQNDAAYEALLNQYKNTFIDWRYLYESVGTKNFDTKFLETLFQVVKTQLSK